MDSPEKFLGSLITFRGKQSETFEFIHQAIAGSLANIDNSYIRNEYKCCVYSKYLLPAIRYKLTVHDLSVSHIYKETHAVSHASSRMKADDTVNAALESRLLREQEWTRKASTTADCEQQFMVATAHEPPAHASPKQQETIKSKIKKNISGEIQNMWRHHIKTLTVQGRFLEILALENSSVSWKSVMYDLPRGILQFAVNAGIDSLATNANLKRWGKRSNAKCDLCKSRETLHHVLNYCPMMMDRYLWRHNSIINFMVKRHQEPTTQGKTIPPQR
jgi:hypothetical protein